MIQDDKKSGDRGFKSRSQQSKPMKEKIMISLRHPGKCSVCRKKIEVVTLGNTKTRKVAYVCEVCSKKLKMKTSTFVKKYGKKDEEPFKPGIRFLPGLKKKRSKNK